MVHVWFNFSMDRITRKWVDAVLANDEVSSDEELVQYFMVEGTMTEANARAAVALRSEKMGKI